MTGSPDNTNLRVALDEATGSLALAQHLRMPSEAQEGAEWAIYALERLPEDVRPRFAGCIAFARGTASKIVADSASALPWNNGELQLRCEELAQALNFIYQKIPPPRHRQHKPRKPSIAELLKEAEEAEKTGKIVTSITTPDGTKYTFGEARADAVTPLEEWRKRRGQS
jgi:hypothetical protein